MHDIKSQQNNKNRKIPTVQFDGSIMIALSTIGIFLPLLF